MISNKALAPALAGFLAACGGLAACATVEASPEGGVARDANYAEGFCQRFGKHAAIRGIVNSSGDRAFSCEAGGRPIEGTAIYPADAEERCQVLSGGHAAIQRATTGIEYVGYVCVGGVKRKRKKAPEEPPPPQGF